MDLSFVKQDKNKACAYLAVLSYPDFKVFIYILYK